MLSSLLLLTTAALANVEVLTQDNFNEFITANSRVLVEFYAPWCGHCKALEPEYKKAAIELASSGSTTKLAKVDGTVETELASKYGVKGFPTLKYFMGDPERSNEYGGGRTQETIVSWLNKRDLPAVTPLASKAELETLSKKGKLVLVAFCYANSEQANGVSTFADNFRDHVIVGQGTQALASEMGLAFPSYILYRSFEPANPKTGGDFGAMEEFFNTHRFPIIDEIGPENYQLYMDRGLPVAWLSVKKDDEASKTMLENAARLYQGTLLAVWVDSVKYNQHVESNLGIHGTPGLMIVAGENSKYRFSDVFTEANIKAFFNSFKAGSLEKFMKSQEPPVSNDKPVKVVVGSTFDEMVLKPTERASFVEFYAPWCGHCKKLAPIWTQLAEKYKSNRKIMIAKVDATENDTPENVQGFPTLVYYPPTGEKEKYTGGRELDDLVAYVDGKLKEMPGQHMDL